MREFKPSTQEFMKDFEIKVEDADLRKKLAKVLCGEIEQSITENDSAYQAFKRAEYQYRGMSKYRQMGQTKNKPWKDACDFWAPVSEWIICAIAARVDSVLFSVEPMMTAMAVESSDVAGEAEITDFVDVVMTKLVQLRDKFKFYVKQMIKQPLSVASYEWVYREENIREIERGIVQPDFSVMLESGQQVMAKDLPSDVQKEIKDGTLQPGQMAYWYVERDKPICNQPEFNYISPTDYVWSANTKKNQKPFLEGYRFWQTIGEVRKKQNNEEYWEYEEIIDALEKTLTQKGSSGDGIKQIIAERSHQYECFKVFTRLPFNEDGELDLEDKEAAEQEVIAEIAYKEQIILKLHKWHYLRYPDKKRCFIYGCYEEKDAIIGDNPFLGRSMSEKIIDINQLINREFQQIVDNADLAMTKVFTKKKMLNDEDWERPEVFPGAIWDVEEQGDIQVLDVGDVKRVGFEIMKQLQDFAVRISNISSMNVASRVEGAKPLATEVVNILKEGEVGREGFIQACHEDLRTIYQWTADYYFQFMPEGLERRIRGENKQLMFPEPPKKEQFMNPQLGVIDEQAYDKALSDFEKNKYYNREMLLGVGKWDFKWNGTQLSGDREWQIQTADYLLKIFGQFIQGGFVTMTGMWEALRDTLIARGKKDWQKYLPPREMLEQIDNQKMAMQQLQANLPQIRQQLLDQGMDPQLVSDTMAKISQQITGGQGGQPQPEQQTKPGARPGQRPA